MRSSIAGRRARGSQIHTVGHPAAPIGMGEHVRSVFHALREAGADPAMTDIYGAAQGADKELVQTYAKALDHRLGDGVNIFCINGDEIDDAFHILRERNLLSSGSKNVIYPAWELDRYPEEWARKLERFDEIWAPSRFIQDCIRKATKTPVRHMPLACEVGRRALRSRRHFGISESAYAFFFSFDFLSYIERKNPFAVIEAFRLLTTRAPYADVSLVIKINNADRRPEMKQRFDEAIADFRDRVTIIDGVLSDLEMKSLTWLVDCFVSLHRSEGFGRGLSEAMALGKPVIATAYSGNMDFCTAENTFLVPYELIPVEPGSYPHWQNQHWADPDAEMAAAKMLELVDDPSVGVAKGRKARLDIRRDFSYLDRGAAYRAQCDELLGGMAE